MENSRPDLRLTQGTFWLDGLEPLIYQDQPVAYLVKLKPQGFMILSDITEVSPQVFISFSGDYDSVRTHSLLTSILDDLKYSKVCLRYFAWRESPGGQGEPEEAPDLVQMERNERRWSILLGGSNDAAGTNDVIMSSEDVAPMLTCHWKQGWPWNAYTPFLDNGAKPPAGCSAIAMAQVMYFWKSPDRGQGSHSYIWHGQTLSADFDHPYYWDRMLDSYDSGYFGAEAIDAVARLVSDVGIAIDMDYESGGSGAIVDPNAFVNYFKYSPAAHIIRRYSVADWAAWFDILKQQMDMRQPVVLSVFSTSSGHALVVDGYRTSPSNQIHVNLGWGESYDCYSNVEQILGFDHGYSYSAVIDIHPAKLRLTIQANAGGTTDPAPGVHDYDYAPGLVVRVTAQPDVHFEFLNWSGDDSTSQNPLDIALDRNKSVTANFQRIIYAPSNAAGEKVLNRSLSQAEYINVITFEPNPDNVDIVHYKIYTVEGGQRTELVTLDANTFKYLHRGVSKNKSYTYQIVAINNEPREGLPATVVIQ